MILDTSFDTFFFAILDANLFETQWCHEWRGECAVRSKLVSTPHFIRITSASKIISLGTKTSN